MPTGWNPRLYGPWPGPIWILKSRYAPSWKSFLDDSNWHTVTSLVCRGPNNNNNRLNLGPLLDRIVALLCDCPAGYKTNSCCAHQGAHVKAIMAPALFRSRKVNESRLTDIYRYTKSSIFDKAYLCSLSPGRTPTSHKAPALQTTRQIALHSSSCPPSLLLPSLTGGSTPGTTCWLATGSPSSLTTLLGTTATLLL